MNYKYSVNGSVGVLCNRNCKVARKLTSPKVPEPTSTKDAGHYEVCIGLTPTVCAFELRIIRCITFCACA